MKVRLSQIERGDLVNSFGKLGLVLWFQGCSRHCVGCQNPELQSFEGGRELDVDKLVKSIETEKYWLGTGYVVFLGGEPTEQLEPLLALNKQVREMGLKTALYTGCSEQELISLGIDLTDFNMIKVGEYDETRRTGEGEFVSDNQYLIVEGERRGNKIDI